MLEPEAGANEKSNKKSKGVNGVQEPQALRASWGNAGANKQRLNSGWQGAETGAH